MNPRKLDRRRIPPSPCKVLTTIRLAPEIVEAFRATGRGWQPRMEAALRAHAEAALGLGRRA